MHARMKDMSFQVSLIKLGVGEWGGGGRNILGFTAEGFVAGNYSTAFAIYYNSYKILIETTLEILRYS